MQLRNVLARSDTLMRFENPDEVARAAESFSKLQGVWRSQGYGKVLLIDGGRYVFFEETAISCRKLYSGTLAELAVFYEDVQVSPAKQAFSAHRATGVTRISFRRLKELPPAAFDKRGKKSNDPEYNFDIFWQTFSEHYALFELKGVAWDQSYQMFRPRIAPGCPRETLFANMAAMLRPLRDGHIRLHTPWGHYGAGARPALYKRLESELEGAHDDRGIANYLGELRERLHDTIQDDYLRGGVRHGANRTVDWGRLSNTTGYLNIHAMAGQSGKIGHPADDLTVTAAIMKTVLTELGGLPNLVVDIRGNGGGYDGVALQFASHLMDKKRLAFSKSARHGNGFTGQQKIHVTPSNTDTYQGNLYILTSELTASAAEIFVLALLQHPSLTLIGEPTQGILSDTLERHLPNGWHLTLSNEIYRAYDGQIYEDIGIPPHIRLQFLGRKGREEGRDPMLDRVLKLVGSPP